MYLTTEQKADGREGFRAQVAENLSRRDFLLGSFAAGVVSAGSLGAFYFGYDQSLSKPLRVGVLGTGDEGSVLIGATNPEFVQIRAIADIRPYNIYRAFHGDVYSEAAEAARPGLLAKYGWKTESEARKHVKVYDAEQGGYEELIKNARRDGIEAVIIALPLHLHAPAALAAMKAGLHVLTEKLMAKTIRDCKQMARVAAETHKYLATGHQRHYNILYAEAQETIRRGVLGEVHYIRAQWHRGNLPGNDSWQQPMPKGIKPDDPQAERLLKELESWEKRLAAARGRQIEVWQKRVAQKRAQIADEILKDTAARFGYEDARFDDGRGGTYYRPAAEELIRWRLWDRTGGGLMAELGSHQLDAASIFIAAVHGGKKQYPLSVAAMANRPVFPRDRDVEDHVYCLLEFPHPDYDPKDPIRKLKKIGVQYASINGNGFGGYGEIVFGTEGTLILEREKEAMLSGGKKPSTVAVEEGAGPTLDTQASGPVAEAAAVATRDVSRGYAEQIEHWAWCIRQDPENRDPAIQPRCHPEVALADAVIALTANLAARKGQRIDFREEWFDPASDETPEG
ncbi:MAG TPA: Gfo/Idh/MocA family oxidoreductase [Planctomycetaceae bacterium]|nr:Gfo/Idh/MocA family oxidoreductase [Planctomycetaceae bacterium]HIQ23330.1 Gfo/Idh/MocA family oxidoreductase [Planctomycetota bacterium]